MDSRSRAWMRAMRIEIERIGKAVPQFVPKTKEEWAAAVKAADTLHEETPEEEL